MNGIMIALCGVMILVVFVVAIAGIVMIRKINNLEESVAELLGDSGKLKKVSVGNYLDIIRIKKRLGMEVGEEDSETGVNESKES